MKVSIEMTAEEAQKGLVVRVCCDGQDVTQLGFPKKMKTRQSLDLRRI